MRLSPTLLTAALSTLALTAASGAHAACVESPAGTYVCDASSDQIDGLRDDNDDVSITIQAGATVLNNGGPNGGDGLRVRGDNTLVVIETGASGPGRIIATGDAVDSGDDGTGLHVINAGEMRSDSRGVNADNENNVTVENSGLIDVLDDGIRLGDGLNAVLTNTGQILSGDEGLEAGDDARVTNGLGALIQATEDAVQVAENALIVNQGVIESTDIDRVTGLDSPGVDPTGDGIDLDSGQIFNTGIITAADGAGIDFDASTVAESLIVNSGEITGRVGIEVELGSVDPANTMRQVVFNDGKITGLDGIAIELGAGEDLVGIFDDLSALSGLSPIPLGSASAPEINGTVDLGDDDDLLAIANLATGGMIYQGVLDGLFDGGAGFDTALFTADLSELLNVKGRASDLRLTFGNGTDSRELHLVNFEGFRFGADPVTGSQGQFVSARALAPVPLPAGVVLLGGALA
ncbi:MAG: hypothetical protein KDA50_13775, partial [Rhodobacteraceae bacterium]|nr:hypothetical protein [Paracoccaceae bacterium]